MLTQTPEVLSQYMPTVVNWVALACRFALGTTQQGVVTVGGTALAGYPTATFVRVDDPNTTTTLALATPASVIRSAGTISHVTNDFGTKSVVVMLLLVCLVLLTI